jgi:hypothetical protein
MAEKIMAQNPVGRVYVSNMIMDELSKGGLAPTFNVYHRKVIVDGVNPTDKSALTYIVGKDGVKGPDPAKHDGNTVIDAIVQNVAEDLSLVGLVFNKDTKRYEGEFHVF